MEPPDRYPDEDEPPKVNLDPPHIPVPKTGPNMTELTHIINRAHAEAECGFATLERLLGLGATLEQALALLPCYREEDYRES